jgi:eukaryotic-like serine/threonine-protein kinase
MAVKQHIVGAYEVGTLLGSGTVGEVYRARHCETGAPAVVKFLHDEAAREPDVQRRFVREVAIAEKLDHPNIVRHYDCGLHDDQFFFAMEFVDCGTLKDVLRQRRTLPWREAAECAIQICAALEYAHQRGIIHRDLKPANLFISAEGKVKVGDFGLARDLNKSRLTLEGQTVGTCRYMAPEQITGEAELTGAADLYALGCILYRAIVGQPPFDGESIIEIFEAHLYSEPRPPAEHMRDCPRDLSDLVIQLLAKDPDERPPSAADVQMALEEILGGRRTRIIPPRPSEACLDSDPSPTSESDATLPYSNTSVTAIIPSIANAKRRLLIAIVAIVSIAVIAIVIWQLGPLR